MENNQSPELVTNKFTKVPNWFFDELLKTRQYSLICVVAYLLREFVGWRKTEFKATQKELAARTGVHGRVVSRWLNALAAIGWINYAPAKNGGGKSELRLLHLPEHAAEVRLLVAAVRLVAHDEQHWAREETYTARSPKNSYVEWQRRPRYTNDEYSELLSNALSHINSCTGCDSCLVVPEVGALRCK